MFGEKKTGSQGYAMKTFFKGLLQKDFMQEQRFRKYCTNRIFTKYIYQTIYYLCLNIVIRQ